MERYAKRIPTTNISHITDLVNPLLSKGCIRSQESINTFAFLDCVHRSGKREDQGHFFLGYGSAETGLYGRNRFFQKVDDATSKLGLPSYILTMSQLHSQLGDRIQSKRAIYRPPKEYDTVHFTLPSLME